MSAYPNAPLEDFKLDHLDIEAARAGTIANAKNWTMADNNIRTTDGSKPKFTDAVVNDSKDVPYGEPH